MNTDTFTNYKKLPKGKNERHSVMCTLSPAIIITFSILKTFGVIFKMTIHHGIKS